MRYKIVFVDFLRLDGHAMRGDHGYNIYDYASALRPQVELDDTYAHADKDIALEQIKRLREFADCEGVYPVLELVEVDDEEEQS